MLFLAPPGSSWLLLAPPGSSWLLLASPGSCWLLLAPPVSSWPPLAPPGSSWLLLAQTSKLLLLLASLLADYRLAFLNCYVGLAMEELQACCKVRRNMYCDFLFFLRVGGAQGGQVHSSPSSPHYLPRPVWNLFGETYGNNAPPLIPTAIRVTRSNARSTWLNVDGNEAYNNFKKQTQHHHFKKHCQQLEEPHHYPF